MTVLRMLTFYARIDVRNDDVLRQTKQPKLTAIIQSRRLTLFGHIMRMDDYADAKRILLVPLQRTGEDNQVVPASSGSAPSKMIWNNTTLRSPKQQIWLRTALCGGWCRRMALRNLRVACQKRRRKMPWQNPYRVPLKGFGVQKLIFDPTLLLPISRHTTGTVETLVPRTARHGMGSLVWYSIAGCNVPLDTSYSFRSIAQIKLPFQKSAVKIDYRVAAEKETRGQRTD